MLKVDLPPDSSWKWEIKTFSEPLSTGRYVLTDDYEKLSAVLEKTIKERDQAVEYLSMRMENLKENGKTILDFQAVWISQERALNEKLKAKVATLEKELIECEKFKQGYYEEAAKGWEKFRELERKVASAYVKKEQ
jgi:hypothetical protein